MRKQAVRAPDVKRAIIVAASIPILLVTAWWTLALVFAGPDPAWLRTGLVEVYALGTLATLLWSLLSDRFQG